MNKNQKIRIALAQFNFTVGDLTANADKIIAQASLARRRGADIVAFPELAVPGYPPEDLLLKPKFIDDNLAQLGRIAKNIGDIAAVVGFADKAKKNIYNAAAVIYRGKVRGVYHKVFLPNYGVFDEKRYFSCGNSFPVFGIGKTAFGVNICEDIWHLNGPAGIQAYRGAKFIININASPYHIGKGQLRREILRKQAKKNNIMIAYVNLVGGQDELVFDGQSMIIDAKGRLAANAGSFVEELLISDLEVATRPKKAKIFVGDAGCQKPEIKHSLSVEKDQAHEVYDALVLGLHDYIVKNGFKKVVLGLSGGIDSSIVACIAVDAVGRDNVVGVSMPSRFTAQESRDDARILAENLGIEFKTISIQEIFEHYQEILKDVFSASKADITEENLQARIRGNIIMALSNKFGFLALNTGNKSEVSCGYCTLYGDMAGGFGVIKDVPKTFVYQLCAYKNKKEAREMIPRRVFDKAPTAELRENQKDSDSLPEYDLLDKVLRQYVEEDKSTDEIIRGGINRDVVMRVARMVDLNEYKRRQAPPGIKITPKAFGRDRRMPITNRY